MLNKLKNENKTTTQQELNSSEYRGGPRVVMVKAMDCGIVVSEFVLQSRYYGKIPLGKV